MATSASSLRHRYYPVFVLLLSALIPGVLAAPVASQPADIMFTLRDNSEKAWKRAQSGDRAGYDAALTRLRDYIRSVYRPNDLDKGWKELASAQLSIGDRNGAKTTAQTIRNPGLRTRLFIDIASKYKDAAAFNDAIQVCLQCPSPEDIGPGMRDIARDMHRAGMASQARSTLRLTTQRLKNALPDPRAEEKRSYQLKLVVIDQIDYRDFEGAKITARTFSDPEHLALTAVGQYKAGDASGCQATFQEAISLASRVSGDRQPYFLEHITYSLLACGIVPTARALAPTIPAPPLRMHHREKAINRVVFALADSGDFAGAKKLADTHLSRHYFVVSSLRIAADQRIKGNATAALATIANARQHIVQFPDPQGGLNEDKVNCLNRLAFVQYLWKAPAECRQTLAASRQIADRQSDVHLRNSSHIDIITMQAMCGDTQAALAAVSRLPPKYQGKAIAEVRKADAYRKSLADGLAYECLDPRKTRGL